VLQGFDELFRMEMRMQSKESMEEASDSAGPSSSLGWPFGLPTCMVIHTPSPKQLSGSTPLAFHQQFLNIQTTFLLPIFSDLDGGSSTSDTDSRSDLASSFFKDSRRITLGSLIGLPLDTSFRLDANYNIFTGRRRNFLPSCGILALLGCVRNPIADFDIASADGEDDTVVTASSRSLAAVSQGADQSDQARSSTVFEDALSAVSRSPDWTDQFVSSHSILFDGEWSGADAGSERIATPASLSVRSSPRHKSLKSQKTIERCSSKKSFLSSICCRIDSEKKP